MSAANGLYSISASGLTAQRSVLKTRLQNNKEQIFCEWRHRWVRLTPEEWVRQQLLHRLVEQLNYPASLIAVEQAISFGETKKRCDAVVYAKTSLPCVGEGLCPIERPVDGRRTNQGGVVPLVLIECKAETVPLTQKTLDQALNYNRLLNVPWLILHNGLQSVVVHLSGEQVEISTALPPYPH